MYLLAGYSDDARALLEHLREESPGLLGQVVIVDPDPALSDVLAPLGVTVICGDPTDLATLLNAGANRARIVVTFPYRPEWTIGSPP